MQEGGNLPAHFLDGLEPLRWPFPEHSGPVAVFSRVADHCAALHPAEWAFIAKAGRERRLAYSSGRRAARRALAALDIHNYALVAKGRRPVWPEGVVGSITHSTDLAVAVVGRASRWAALGTDVERQGRVSARIAGRVLNAAERKALPDTGWRTALFSAKESVYKAVHPLCGVFLAFEDVEIAITERGHGFTARAPRQGPATAHVAAGKGFFFRYAGHWLALFVVPARGEQTS